LQPRDIFVIGGSAGSIEALSTIVRDLPANFSGSIFVVVHVTPESPGMLAQLLSRIGSLQATSPLDAEDIQRGQIYVARPDHHLTIENGKVRGLRGPRENRHRPAIDPLFRTAAREYGPRVVGVILSGLQDDGSAGLYAIKRRGGITIVQDPNDAMWKEMPKQALEYVEPNYLLPARDIGPTILKLVNAQEVESAMAKKISSRRKSNGRNQRIENEKDAASVAPEQPDENKDVAYSEEGEGAPSVFACPECHGVLWELKDDKMVRFRCRVGHSYGTESLTKEISMASESALWAAVRALEEKAALGRRVAEGMGTSRSMSSRLLDQSAADASNARLIREMIFHRDAELESLQFEPDKKKIA